MTYFDHHTTLCPAEFQVCKWGELRSRSYHSVRFHGLETDHLCYDEMLGTVARLCLRGELREGIDTGTPSPHEALVVLRITRVERTSFTLEHDGQFIDRLTFDELLAFVAVYLRSGEQLFQGLRPYVECAAVHPSWLRPHAVAGLLPHQPTRG